MIRIKKIYSEPKLFEPIEFFEGVNLILGERVTSEETTIRQYKKTNGVGKSLCIEFINFCLLKATDESRVMLIPQNVLKSDTRILLDIVAGTQEITICRTTKDPEKPIFIIDQKEIPFDSLFDAGTYLSKFVYDKDDLKNDLCPTFRELMGPIIRDETSEFKELLRCYDVNRNITDRILCKPHLYFFGMNIGLIDEIETKVKEITKNKAVISSVKNDLTTVYRVKMKDVKAQVNALRTDLEKIKQSLDKYESDESFEAIQKDLAVLNTDLDSLRSTQAACRYELQKIQVLPKMEHINKNEIEIVYNQFKDGLGELIIRNLEDTLKFKNKIEEFQANLMSEKVKTLNSSLREVTAKIKKLEEVRSSKLLAIDSKGLLKDIKNAYAVYESKSQEYRRMQSQYEEYEKKEHEKKLLEQERKSLTLKLDTERYNIKKVIEDFNKTVVAIHEYIMGNNVSSFDIRIVDNSAQVVEFDMRIYDDGSHSVNREKVFIYDMALMFNEHTATRHPRLLIHDNIFDVDQDTLVQSLNYLQGQEEQQCNFQYILTLNHDKIEGEEKENRIKLDIKRHVRASFTKEKRFLNQHYQEL
ncbi:MAG: DUF2326 domain-containing protein [Candidatus Omnitrophica bacterium]|nr:DUF2326 domain-containing protein [Candidatus Omnitrophota bacterium]